MVGTCLKVGTHSRGRLFNNFLDKVGAYSKQGANLRGALIQGFNVGPFRLFSVGTPIVISVFT